MLLKRKRSDDELSSFSGGGVGYSSPMRSDNGDIVMMDTSGECNGPLSPRNAMLSTTLQNRSRSCTPSHLPSRTFKRLRNGRPSEEEVHHNTLKMLYQAQQQQPQQPHHVFSPPATPVSMPSMPPPPQAASAQNQSSLHSFWKIPAGNATQPAYSSAPSAPAACSGPSLEMVNRPTNCEDCGVGLSEDDSMMDDGYGFETYINTCSACSRAVCFSCSVSNLGEQRRCLVCAGREGAGMGAGAGADKNKKWIGGIGWSSGGVTVC